MRRDAEQRQAGGDRHVLNDDKAGLAKRARRYGLRNKVLNVVPPVEPFAARDRRRVDPDERRGLNDRRRSTALIILSRRV